MNNQQKTISDWLKTGSINIFGLPFAGKDTQGKILAEMFNGVVISGGDILRSNKDNQELQQIMASGQIIPSDLWEQIVVPYLANSEFDNKPIILSEVGRLAGEELVVEKATKEAGHEQKAVILLNLSDEEVWNRFEASQKSQDRGQRADDNKAVIQTRLDSYHNLVKPVIDYYRQNGSLIEIDGSLAKEEVTAAILDALELRANN
ncbi:nucleoside monophosphate kinase [Candidatus Nomurabacteria bacterium]|jgi:adenylate kinase|nr:nucleoside monophosphate kinase [Candidatus Saccharibacteria bacterium]MCA9350124.1 nucleoside monophosphate kinase [Candidatus Saccharibacteria bacterium]MCB9839336.1 nucleoside monophosphate kinase [Candidatus Nomurabacteria bacterium]